MTLDAMHRLVVVFMPQHPVVRFDAVADVFEHAGRRYRDAGFGDFTGFYDWLRRADGRVIGVRYLPFEASRGVGDAVAALPYVEVSADRSSLTIFFSADRAFEPAASGDQAFGGNRVFVTDDGAYALTFDAGSLDEAERDRLAPRAV
jgi:hypothetical protein